MTKGSAESGCLGKFGIFLNLQSNFETFTQVEISVLAYSVFYFFFIETLLFQLKYLVVFRFCLKTNHFV